MKRWVWNSFCFFSLLLFAGSVTLWVRSYFVCEGVAWRSAYDECDVIWSRGTALLFRGHRLASTLPDWEYRQYDDPGNQFSRLAGGQVLCLGPVWWFRSGLGQGLIFPLWLFLPAVIPPILWWRKWRKQGRGRGFPVEPARPAEEELNHQDTKATKIGTKS